MVGRSSLTCAAVGSAYAIPLPISRNHHIELDLLQLSDVAEGENWAQSDDIKQAVLHGRKRAGAALTTMSKRGKLASRQGFAVPG